MEAAEREETDSELQEAVAAAEAEAEAMEEYFSISLLITRTTEASFFREVREVRAEAEARQDQEVHSVQAESTHPTDSPALPMQSAFLVNRSYIDFLDTQ